MNIFLGKKTTLISKSKTITKLDDAIVQNYNYV